MGRIRLLVAVILAVALPGAAFAYPTGALHLRHHHPPAGLHPPGFTFGNCRDARYVRAFDERLAPADCTVVASSTITLGSGGGRVSVPIRAVMYGTPHATFDTRSFTHDFTGFTRNLEQAVNAIASDPPPPITILIDPQPDRPEDRAASWPRHLTEECTVPYFHTSPAPDRLFKAAHAVFHCIQGAMWSDARLAYTDADYWAEGTAEYFANLVFPGSGFTDQDARDFSANESASLQDRSADSLVFFSWLGATKGAPEILNFIDSVQNLAGSLQLDALVDEIEADDWAAFEGAYDDGAIPDAGGSHRLPISPGPVQEVRVDHAGDYDFQSRPLIIMRKKLKFVVGNTYQISRASGSEEAIKVLWSSTPGNWAAPPTGVVACDHDQVYHSVAASKRTPERAVYHVDLHRNPAGACLCPVGSWNETVTSLRRHERRLASVGLGGSSRTTYLSGGRRLTINPDHSGTFAYESLVFETRTTPEDWLHQTQGGTIPFSWKTVGDMLLAIPERGHNMITLHNVSHFRGGRSTSETRQAGAQSIGHHFSCDSSGLHLTTPRGDGLYDMDFFGTVVAPQPAPR
jgi:hypothetical protein